MWCAQCKVGFANVLMTTRQSLLAALAISPALTRAELPRKKHHLAGDAFFLAGPAGFEPVISSVTGRRDNHFTTSPRLLSCECNRGNHSKVAALTQGYLPSGQGWARL
jgi:hypothetical protein